MREKLDGSIFQGAFDRVKGEENRNQIMRIVAEFHYRTGVKQPDGSMGEIRITNRQMNDVVAWVIENTK